MADQPDVLIARSNKNPHVDYLEFTMSTYSAPPDGRREEILEMGDMPGEKLTLMEKWRRHRHKWPPSDFKSKYGFRILFQFQAVTQLYMTLVYHVPYVCSECDLKTQNYLKLLACYIFVMGEANWVCAICYSCRLHDLHGRLSLEQFRNSPKMFSHNGYTKSATNPVDKNGLEWKFCSKCDQHKPPRTQHCDVCRACIVRRDHHCYLIGTCIGHSNQRFFIVFCFLGVITGILGLIFTISYLSSLTDPDIWLDYVFPWPLVKLCVGQASWQFCLLTFHVEMLLMFGTMSFLYGVGQFSLACVGLTLNEVAKHVDVTVSSSYNENLKIVFGDYWALNFLFPAQVLFKQRHNGVDFDNIRIGSSKINVE